MKILELEADDRPRERLLRKGAESLSTAELLAILLRTGKKGTNAIDVARQMLSLSEGSLGALARSSVDKLCRTSGVGKAKAATLAACFELALRMEAEKKADEGAPVKSAEAAARILSTLYRETDTEECWSLFLRRSGKVISSMKVSDGGETFTDLNIKKIVRSALDCGAAGVIISHNHPSGNPTPSAADVSLTGKLHKALDTFDINLLDHIIVAEPLFYSFQEECSFSL